MNPRLILLALCLAGNALLAVALYRRDAAPARPADMAGAKISRPAAQISGDQPGPAAGLATVETVDFQWSQLIAPDLAVYIVQLRAFSTPDPKVRDIIYGAVEAVYRPQRGALRPPPKAGDGKFWEQRNFYGGGDSLMTRTQREQMRALQKDEADLLKSLFGEDFASQRAQDAGYPDWMEKLYAFIPKELREQVQDIDSQLNDAKQAIYAENEGSMDQYAQADLQKVEKKYRDELAKILTPDQLLDWAVRHSDTANQLKNELSAFDPDEDEFRELFKYKQAQADLNPPRDPDADPVPATADDRKALAEKRKALDDGLAQTLGADRVKEYKLDQDYGYRNLIDSGVPKASVFQLDDMKKQAQDAAKKIRNDPALSPGQRTAALAAIRAETQESINGLLDAKQAKQYSSQGGGWLNNLAPAARPQ